VADNPADPDKPIDLSAYVVDFSVGDWNGVGEPAGPPPEFKAWSIKFVADVTPLAFWVVALDGFEYAEPSLN